MSLQVKSCHRYIGLAEPRSHVYSAAAREAGKKGLASTLRRHRLKWGKSLHTERVFKYIEEIQRRMINFHYTGVQLRSLTWETFSKTTARIKVSLFCLSVICYLHIYWVIITTDVIHIPPKSPHFYFRFWLPTAIIAFVFPLRAFSGHLAWFCLPVLWAEKMEEFTQVRSSPQPMTHRRCINIPVPLPCGWNNTEACVS